MQQSKGSNLGLKNSSNVLLLKSYILLRFTIKFQLPLGKLVTFLIILISVKIFFDARVGSGKPPTNLENFHQKPQFIPLE